jgi:hypothetical protein
MAQTQGGAVAPPLLGKPLSKEEQKARLAKRMTPLQIAAAARVRNPKFAAARRIPAPGGPQGYQ